MTHETKHLGKYETEIDYLNHFRLPYASRCYRIRPYQYDERYGAYQEHFYSFGIYYKRIADKAMSICWHTLSIDLETRPSQL